MEHQAKVIALSGKGGVGKTSVSAAAVRLLTEKYPDARILAIDADPAVGLSSALGVEAGETLDDIRRRVAEDVTGKLKDTQDVLAEAKFHIFEAMQEKDGFAFLAIGRPEDAGCYCAINTYLRQSIELLVSEFDFVVIDGEAGIEQINRRVMEKVTHLIIVSDQSRKGIQVIHTIKNVADNLVMSDKTGIILNRVIHPELITGEPIADAPLAAAIGIDEVHAMDDVEGLSIFSLPAGSELLRGVETALRNLEIL